MAGPEAPGAHRRAAPSPPMEGMEGEPGEVGAGAAGTPFSGAGSWGPARGAGRSITACAEPLSAPPEPAQAPLPRAAFPPRAGPAPWRPGLPGTRTGSSPSSRRKLVRCPAAGVLAWPYRTALATPLPAAGGDRRDSVASGLSPPWPAPASAPSGCWVGSAGHGPWSRSRAPSGTPLPPPPPPVGAAPRVYSPATCRADRSEGWLWRRDGVWAPGLPAARMPSRGHWHLLRQPL